MLKFPVLNKSENISINLLGDNNKKTRIFAFDLARGLAVLFMIMQHVLFMFGTSEVHTSLLGGLILGLCTLPAAPVFLFLMGVFYKYSERDEKERHSHGLRRGIKLLFIGYLLNLLRFTIPILIRGEIHSFNLWDSEPLTPLYSLLFVDILQCAGLSLILIIIIDKFFKREISYITIAIIILFISPILWGTVTYIGIVDLVLNLLWGTTEYVQFPVFPYSAYVVIGIAFRQKLQSGIAFDDLVKSSRNRGF